MKLEYSFIHNNTTKPTISKQTPREPKDVPLGTRFRSQIFDSEFILTSRGWADPANVNRLTSKEAQPHIFDEYISILEDEEQSRKELEEHLERERIYKERKSGSKTGTPRSEQKLISPELKLKQLEQARPILGTLQTKTPTENTNPKPPTPVASLGFATPTGSTSGKLLPISRNPSYHSQSDSQEQTTRTDKGKRKANTPPETPDGTKKPATDSPAFEKLRRVASISSQLGLESEPPRDDPPPNPPMASTSGTQSTGRPDIKFKKPEIFRGNPSKFRAWLSQLKIYCSARRITDDRDKIYLALTLMEDAAANWRDNFYTTNTNWSNWNTFEDDLKKVFAPTQKEYEYEQQLRDLRQNGRYIEEYISEFAILASQAGATADNSQTRAYFAEGLDHIIRIQAISYDPKTLEEWKEAARKAYRVLAEQARVGLRLPTIGITQPGRRSKSFKKRKQPQYSFPKYPNYNYAGYSNPKPQRNEWDMDVDQILQSRVYQTIRELSYDKGEEEESNAYQEAYEHQNDDDEDDSSDDEASKYSEALNHIINNILTNDQRKALRNNECFFCKKVGHFYKDCPARKTSSNGTRTKGMDRKQSYSKGNTKKMGTKYGPKSRTKRPNPHKTVVYQINEESEDEDSDNAFDEFSNGNFP